MPELHFLYPFVLLLIPVWLLALVGYRQYHYQQKNWDALVDKALQPFVITGYKNLESHTNSTNKTNKNHWLLGSIALAGLFAILALSGPSIHKQEIPLYEDQQGLVIALDLSTSMLAQDVKPNRIQHAKFALIDLLKQHQTGYVALVVFAGDSFAVSPLTNDSETLFAQLTYMSPSIMPAQGSRLDKAIDQSVALLGNAGYQKGNILLITDGLSDQEKSEKSAKVAHDKAYEVSILAIGTREGAMIPLDSQSTALGRVLRDKQGKEVIAQLDKTALQAVVNTGNGILLHSTLANSGIDILLNRYKTDSELKTSEKKSLEYWINSGIWLVFPLLFMVLLLFRQGMIGLLCLLVLIPTDPVYASESAWNWNDLWLNQQQQAIKLLDNNKAVEAGKLFKDKQWKAAAAYRAKEYTLAEQLYAQDNSADAWFNRGNTLVKMQQFTAAIRAYQVVLEKQPEHSDAQYNLQLISQIQQEMSNATPIENPILQSNESTHPSTEKDVAQATTQQETRPSTQEKEQRAFDKQWLKSIPEDPSGLWRRKFRYQYKIRNQQPEVQLW